MLLHWPRTTEGSKGGDPARRGECGCHVGKVADEVVGGRARALSTYIRSSSIDVDFLKVGDELIHLLHACFVVVCECKTVIVREHA